MLRLPLHLLLTRPDEPPLHLPAVAALLDGSRVDDRPLDVAAVDGTPHYRIRNGRHRYVAALARGDRDIPCTVRPSPEA